MTRTRRLVAVAAAAFSALGLAACGTSAVDPGNRGDQGFVDQTGAIKVIDRDDRVPAPAISGRTLTGSAYTVADDIGGVVVINFWGSWCPPCRTEQADLNEAYAATRDVDARFLGIDIRDDDSAAAAFVRTHDVAYPSIVDKLGQLSLDFTPAIPATPPTTVVLDKQGRVAARIIGGGTIDGVLEPIVEQLAHERPERAGSA